MRTPSIAILAAILFGLAPAHASAQVLQLMPLFEQRYAHNAMAPARPSTARRIGKCWRI